MIFDCFLDPDPRVFLLWVVVAELNLEFAFRLELFCQSRLTASEPNQHLFLFF